MLAEGAGEIENKGPLIFRQTVRLSPNGSVLIELVFPLQPLAFEEADYLLLLLLGKATRLSA